MPLIETTISTFKNKQIIFTYDDLLALLSVYGINVPEGGNLKITYQSKSTAVEANGIGSGDEVVFSYTALIQE